MVTKLVMAFVLSAVGIAAAVQCPAYIPPVTANISQTFNGGITPFVWTISPFDLVNSPPAGSTACPEAGYISEYYPGGACVVAATVQSASPYVDGDTCVYSFSDGGNRFMTLTLTCDQSADVLSLAPIVPVTYSQDNLTFLFPFTGSYYGVCDPPPGQCPGNAIPPVTATIEQTFNGVNTPFEWTISPSFPINSNTCPFMEYVRQYTAGGNCGAAADEQTNFPYVNGYGACVYSFSDNSGRFMTVTLSCDPNARKMNFTSTVPVTQAGDSYTWAFTGSYYGVCVDTNADANKPPKMKSVYSFGRKQTKNGKLAQKP